MTHQARLTIYRDRAKQFRWRLRAANGCIVASGESHPRERDAWCAFHTVARLIQAGVVTSVAGSPVRVLFEARPRRRRSR